MVATFPLAASGRAGTLGAREASPGSSPTPRPTASSACTSSARTPASSWPAARLAIELMAAPGDVAATIHPHPTLSEGLREAAELMLGRPLHVAGPGGARRR